MNKTLHLTALGIGLLAFEITSLDFVPRDGHDSNHGDVANTSTNLSPTQFGSAGRIHRVASSPSLPLPKKSIKHADDSEFASRVIPAQDLKSSRSAAKDDPVSPKATLSSEERDSENRGPVISLPDSEQPDVTRERGLASFGQDLRDWTWMSKPNGFDQMTKRALDFFFTEGDFKPGAEAGKNSQSLWITKDFDVWSAFAGDPTVSLGQNENTIKRFANLSFDFGLILGGPSEGGWGEEGESSDLFQGDTVDTAQNAKQDSDLSTLVQPIPEPSVFVLASLGIMAWMTLAIGKWRRNWVSAIPSKPSEISRPRSRSR